MNEWKKRLIDAVVEETRHCRIVPFYPIAKKNGYDHIDRHDVVDIMRGVLAAAPDYRAARFVGGKHGSLFNELTFLENGVSIEDYIAKDGAEGERKMRAELFENNGGGLSLCVMGRSGECQAIFCGLEYVDDGTAIALEMLRDLLDDPDVWQDWDGEIHDYAGLDPDENPTADLYREISDSDALVAWISDDGEIGTDPAIMGYAAKKAMGIDDEDDE